MAQMNQNQLKSAASIQKHLPIKEIKDDVVLLKSGGVRAVLMASSVNFALKSEDEQQAIVFGYQNFLNSLDFDIQIMVNSRKFDIEPYILSLKQKELAQKNELLKIQTGEYINYVRGLTEMGNIMTESFFVIVPYSPILAKKQGLTEKILGFFQTQPKTVSQDKEMEFQELRNQLWQRVEFVSSALSGAGVKSVPLNTQELVELFYKIYNPSAKENPELKKAQEMRMTQ